MKKNLSHFKMHLKRRVKDHRHAFFFGKIDGYSNISDARSQKTPNMDSRFFGGSANAIRHQKTLIG
ncbi:hypothetical protein N005_04780 [Pseudomonas mediterranea CFBP 5447]|nr:hypothetical protein N005_04780 [Pseudomonas mediterranea CFBP 5447]